MRQHRGDRILQAGGLALDIRACCAGLCGREVRLTPRESRLLELLMRNPDEVLTRPEIIKAVWRSRSAIRSRTVDVTIGRLRRKLRVQEGGLPAIEAVPSVGYRLRMFPDRHASFSAENRMDLHGLIELLPEERLGVARELLALCAMREPARARRLS